MPHRSWSMFLILFGSARASLPLPHGLEWRRIDDRQVGTTVRSLLHSSYVATPEEDLRLDYSASALQWMLCAPGAIDELRVAIAEPDDFSIVAFVCAVPCAFVLDGEERQSAVEVSLLCVRHDWRGKGLTRLLLAELRRRAAEKGIATAIYTAAEPRHRDQFAVLTTCPLHRPLRPLDLLRCGFWQPPDESYLPASPRRRRALLRAAVSEAGRLPSPAALLDEVGGGDGRARPQPARRLRKMRARDAPWCRRLLMARAAHFALSPAFSPEQFGHRFLGRGAHSLVLCAPRGRRGEKSRETSGAKSRETSGAKSRESGMPLDGLYGWISFTLIPLRTADGKRLVQAQLLGYALSAYAGSELGSDSSSSSSGSGSRDRGRTRRNVDGSTSIDEEEEVALMELLRGALVRARRLGAHVFNAHGLAELARAPNLLRALGFVHGDAATSICLDGLPGATNRNGMMLQPEAACWLPVL